MLSFPARSAARTGLVIALALAAWPAAAADTLLVAPVFSQIVTMPSPPGFQEGFETAEPPSYIHEIVPEGETVQHWSQMITLTGSQGLATEDPGKDAMRVAGALGGGYRRACPDSLVGVKLAPPKVAGARAVFAGFLGCGTSGRSTQSEAMVFLVMVGAQDVYTLQWAERGPALVGKMPFDRALWQGRLAELAAGARICDKVKGEGPPYPSCTGR